MGPLGQAVEELEDRGGLLEAAAGPVDRRGDLQGAGCSDRAVTDMKEMKVCIGMHPYVI